MGAMNSTVKRGVGFTDRPAIVDNLDIEKYTAGLADFIKVCNTPITISIQGSWGTGKTSFMQLVESELSQDIMPVWFNTWQFSQFNMDEQLPVSLLSGLIAKLEIEDQNTLKQANACVNVLRYGYKALKSVGLGALRFYMGNEFAEGAEKAVDNIEKNLTNDNVVAVDPDPALSIIKLKDEFEACIKKVLEEKNVNRIVFFIDDLDRLNPGKAVELLEVLKLFLDCEGCVYVLAIDYDVVCLGVESKYGSLGDDSEASKEKGRSFFDKIIQVPFKMPVAKYNISGYVKTCFEQIGIVLPEEKDAAVFVDLIKASIGTNPRAMKRLFNAFQLLLNVVPKNLVSTMKEKRLLFAVLCLQYCNETIYNIIVRNSKKMTFEMFNALLKGNYEIFTEKAVEQRADLENLTETTFEDAGVFLDKLKDALDLDSDGVFEAEEFELFKNLLDWSTITDTTTTDEEKSKKRGVESREVSIQEFNLFGNSEEDVNHIKSVIQQFGEDITIILWHNKGVDLIKGKINNGCNTFIEVYGRKNGYAIDLTAPDKSIFCDGMKYSDIIECANAMGAKLSPQNKKCVTKTVYKGEALEAEEKQIIELGKKLYNVWTNPETKEDFSCQTRQK